MNEQDRSSDHAANVTETDRNITAVGYIVDDRTPHLLGGDEAAPRRRRKPIGTVYPPTQ